MAEPHPTGPGGPGRVHVHDANNTKDVPWYIPIIPALMSPPLIDLLENYAGMPPSEQEAHLYRIRDLAWEVFPMPSVGLFWWLVLGLSTHPHYRQLIELMKSPPTDPSHPRKFLDLGACLGQDSRKLIHDGIPSSSVYASDIFPGYESVGHALFNDAPTTHGHFIAADIFDSSRSSPLVRSRGTWDAISIFMFLHMFSREDLLLAIRQVLLLLSAEPGSMIIGAQTSSTEDHEEVLSTPFLKEGVVRKVFRPSKETFKQMWQEAALDMGIGVKVWAEYRPRWELGETEVEQNYSESHAMVAKDEEQRGKQRRMFFTVERL
ncbi:uncharacterized protein PAC_01626 [Phialocephala subalpina]|uniref:Methyltransferase domain-containing protein n=1 Tax=Phialocephala subalpina TaxID=576137 RepID=A0A1L7WG70_9HELO|nr:uncharacterized protein PAC_01626 [Phialocephala subalpina]